jgi:hypothetical protein
MRAAAILLAIVCASCGSEGVDPRHAGDASTRDAFVDPGATDGAQRDGGIDDAGVHVDTSIPDAAMVPAAMSCSFRSSTYDAPSVELDVGPSSPLRLRFSVPGAPDPALIVSATLSFTSHDADHPGEEGVIRVNATDFDLPAMLAWDNLDASSTVDVTGALVPGANTIEFGPGPLDRSFFGISAVRLDVVAHVDACAPPPDPTAVERRLHFHEGTFTNRATWVVPCPPGHPRFAAIRDYAFTASGAEHESTDCDGLYRAGSGERGTATYVFPDVIASTYGVYVSFRTSANRNPRGALFILDGEEQRIDQVDASGDYQEVLFGDRALAGTVTVVLDSSREAESDSITEIRLVPR